MEKQKETLKHTPADPDNPFPYGWREVPYINDSGEEDYYEIPLTVTDILNPQFGDRMPQNSFHSRLRGELYGIFRQKYAQTPDTNVYCDMKMIWGIADLEEPAPDLAIVPKLKNKEVNRELFDVQKEGTCPCLIIEIMDPTYPGDDTAKVRIYQQAGIQEYIIIAPPISGTTTYTIWGYQLVNGQYQTMPPTPEGHLFSKTTGVYFTLDKSGDDIELKLFEITAGKPLLTASEIYEAHQVAKAQIKKEIKARQAAEAKAEKEALARQAETKRANELEKQLKALQAKLKQQ